MNIIPLPAQNGGQQTFPRRRKGPTKLGVMADWEHDPVSLGTHVLAIINGHLQVVRKEKVS